MNDSPELVRVEFNRNLGLDARRKQADLQEGSWRERDSVPRSPGFENSLQRIKNESQNESFPVDQNQSSCNNYVLRSRLPLRCMAERIGLGSASFRLDSEDTFSAYTFSGGLERKGMFTREVEACGDGSNESLDALYNILPENHDDLQSPLENEIESATLANDNLKTDKSAICQPEERALPVQGPLAEWVYTKIDDDLQTPNKGFLDWKSFQGHFYKHILCLEIGSWICDGEYPGYPNEQVVPAISMTETGRYPKHLNDENLGATQCAGNTVSTFGSSGSGRPTKETARVVANAPVGKKMSKGKKRICDNDDNDDDENDTNHDGTNDGRRTRAKFGLVCPLHWRLSQFSAIDDETRVKYRVCTTTKFDDVARVKEHLNRVHKHIICGRCQKTFKQMSQLDSHLAEVLSCKLLPRESPSMKMTYDEVEKLDAMKKNRGPEREKWVQIYQIFFPGSSVPSPYEHDPNVVASIVLPKDTEAVDFLKDHLPNLLWSKLEPTFDDIGLSAAQKDHLKYKILRLGPSIRASFQAQHGLCPEPPGSLDQHAPFSGSGGPMATTMNPSPTSNFHSDQQSPENENFVLQGNEEYHWSGFEPSSSATAFASNRELNHEPQISSDGPTVAKDHWNRPLHPVVPHPRRSLERVPPQTPNNSGTVIAQSRIDNRPTSTRQLSFSDSAIFSLPSSGQGTVEGHLHRSSMGSMTSPCPNPKDAPGQGQDSSKAPFENTYRDDYEPYADESLHSYFQDLPWSASNDFANQDNEDENFYRTNGSQ